MNVGVRSLEPHEIPAAAKLMANSYWEDPLLDEIFCSRDMSWRLDMLEIYFVKLLSLAWSLGHIITISDGDKLSGVAIYYLQDKDSKPNKVSSIMMFKAFFTLTPKVGLLVIYKLTRLYRALNQAHPHQPHIYVELGCVARNMQNSGIGTRLCSQVFSIADATGIGVYAETFNSVNLPIFQKMGYEVRGRFRVGPSTCWQLWHAPSNVLVRPETAAKDLRHPSSH